MSSIGRFSPGVPGVKVQERRGRLRGRHALRLVDGIDGAMMAASDPLELRTLAELAARADRLARRSYGARGMFR